MANMAPGFVDYGMTWAGKLTGIQAQIVAGLARKASLQLQPPPPELLVNLGVGVVAQILLETALRHPKWAETWAERLGRIPADSASIAALLAALPAGKEEEPDVEQTNVADEADAEARSEADPDTDTEHASGAEG